MKQDITTTITATPAKKQWKTPEINILATGYVNNGTHTGTKESYDLGGVPMPNYHS